MKVTAASVFVGPGIHAAEPVIRLVVDPGDAGKAADVAAAVADGLRARLPAVGGDPSGDGAADLTPDALFAGRAVLAAAVALQRLAGHQVGAGSVRPAEGGACAVMYPYEDADTGVGAGRLAVALVDSLLSGGGPPAGFDFARQRDAFLRDARAAALSADGAYLVAAARRRGIPWASLGNNVIQFGQGCRRRRTFHAFTDATGYIGVRLSTSKAQTNRLLRAVGLPVPAQRVAGDAAQASAAAAAIGYPVVVKPVGSDMGRGVSVGVADAAAVAAAFERARRHAQTVVIESLIEGDDHRLLVVDGRFVAAARRVPGHVVGDGRRSVEELVAALNSDPRRTPDTSTPLTPLALDAQAERMLAEAGYDRAGVPKEGETVFLRATANLSTGGSSVDVTDDVHPDNRRLAERAARALGLDVAGVDFLTTDIGRSYLEAGGAVCEVNCTPALYVHYACSEGRPRDVAAPILDMLFPAGATGRIPIATVTGGPNATEAARAVARLLGRCGPVVGLAGRGGLFTGGQRAADGDLSGARGARMVLSDATVDAAVLETPLAAVLRQGLGYDRCTVAALVDGAPGDAGPEGAEALAAAAGAAEGGLVVNADDDACLEAVGAMEAARMWQVSADPANRRTMDHVAAGGPAVMGDENGAAVLIEKGERLLAVPAAALADLGGTDNRAPLVALAVLRALGRTPAEVLAAVQAADPDPAD